MDPDCGQSDLKPGFAFTRLHCQCCGKPLSSSVAQSSAMPRPTVTGQRLSAVPALVAADMSAQVANPTAVSAQVATAAVEPPHMATPAAVSTHVAAAVKAPYLVG